MILQGAGARVLPLLSHFVDRVGSLSLGLAIYGPPVLSHSADLSTPAWFHRMSEQAAGLLPEGTVSSRILDWER